MTIYKFLLTPFEIRQYSATCYAALSRKFSFLTKKDKEDLISESMDSGILDYSIKQWLKGNGLQAQETALEKFQDILARKAWNKIYHRVPQDELVIQSIPIEELEIGSKYPQTLKSFLRLMKCLKELRGDYPPSLGEIEYPKHLWRIAVNYGLGIEKAIAYLLSVANDKRYFLRKAMFLSLGLELRQLTTSEIGFLLRNTKNYALASQIVSNWEEWKEYGSFNQLATTFKRNRRKAELAKLLADKKYPEIALLAIENELDYSEIEERLDYIEKRHSSIPFACATSGKYKMYRTDDEDPRNLFLGCMTDCCQHPEGEGETCAWHGISSPDGAFFVVEKDRKVIAQSWTWRRGDTLVFDNVEALSGFHGSKTIKSLYLEVAGKLLGKFGIKRVNAGLGHDDLGLYQFPLAIEGQVVNTPRNCYTDAEHQVVLAEIIPASLAEDAKHVVYAEDPYQECPKDILEELSEEEDEDEYVYDQFREEE